MGDVTSTLRVNDQASSVLRSIANTARQTASSMKQVGANIDNAFKSNAPNTFSSKVGSAMRSAQSAASSLGDKIDNIFDDSGVGEFASEINSGFQSASASVNEFQGDVESATDAIEDMSNSAEDLGNTINDFDGGGIDELSEDANKAGEAMKSASNDADVLTNALKTLFAAVTVASIAKGVKDFVSDSIDVGRGFSSTMSEVAAISGATGAEFEMLESTARSYGATTVFSASESAEALKYMSLAGWDAQQSASALGGVLDLAASSGMGLGQSADMVTDYLSAFGMSADRASYFADMLAYAQSHSNTSAQQLGEAYLNSAANMNAAGQDIETTTALLEAMANQGTKGARAGTQLAAMMRDITNKMEDGQIQIGETSIAVQDQYGNFRDLTDILYDVESAVDGLGSAERAAALAETFTADSTKGINQILTEGMDNISKYEDELRDSAGAAGEAANTMTDNLEGDMAAMNSAYEEMQIQVYESLEGTLRNGAQYVTNSIIPALTEWVPKAAETVISTVSKIGSALEPMFTFISKNPKLIGTAIASIGTGLLVFKGLTALPGIISGIGSAISAMGSAIMANPWVAGAAALVAAIIAIKAAVDDYNDMQIKNSLDARFGNINLSTAEIEELSSRVLGLDWVANINLAMGEFENAKEFHQQAEDALNANDVILWKAKIQTQIENPEYTGSLKIKLTPEMEENFKMNVQSFLDAKMNELNSITFATKTSMETILGDKAGAAMIAQVQSWAAEDTAELETLSSSLTSLVEKALEDGVLDVEEQAAIDILQQKINNILSGWQTAQAEAEWQTFEMKWSGSALTPESFTAMQQEMASQRQTAMEALYANTTEMNAVFNGWLNSGRITPEQRAQFGDLWQQNMMQLESETLARGLLFENNTLADTYGDVIGNNVESIKSKSATAINEIREAMANGSFNGETIWDQANQFYVPTTAFSSADQKALSGLYAQMEPDVNAMSQVIDKYRELGYQVPREVSEAFNNAIEIGAAVGNENAAWQNYANAIVSSGDEALIDAFTNKENEWYDYMQSMFPELADAVERAAYMAENTSDVDLSEFFNSILGLDDPEAEIDMAKLAALCEEFGVDISEYLAEKGIDVDGSDTKININDFDVSEAAEISGLTATGNAITLNGGQIAFEYEVNTGDTLENIAQKAGVALEELQAANSHIFEERGTWDLIYPGDLIYVPQADTEGTASAVSEAVSEAQTAAQTAADGQTGEAIETSGTVDIELDSTDNSSAVYSDVDTNVQTEFNTDIETDGTTTVTLEETNNSAEIYTEVGTAIDTAFAAGFSASATVDVVLTANYSLANPTKTISFSGGATGSSTVTATLHAMGGYFENEHIGIVAEAGPEYIIPMDGSNRSAEMWADAGNMLGLLNTAPSEGIAKPNTNSGGENRKAIDLNINGSGIMSVESNMSKNDVVDIIVENIKDVLMEIIQQEILTEGKGYYEY